MKFFIDTEFIEHFVRRSIRNGSGFAHTIDLISIGIVSEDGREYEAISSGYRWSDADEWVQDNVISPIYIRSVHGDQRNQLNISTFQRVKGKSNAIIAREILEFVNAKQPHSIEFVGYYCDYDWVLFCSLFGRMINLPKGFPMYCIDLQQEKDRLGVNSDTPGYPEQNGEHIALEDAKWNKKLYDFLSKYKNENKVS